MPISAAKDLKKGDKIQSASGKTLTVTSVKNTENRAIVLFDGDMEIDFAPFTPLKVLTKEKVTGTVMGKK
jgi:preprotein translocase subunit YajC